jgi:hypothetical protein
MKAIFTREIHGQFTVREDNGTLICAFVQEMYAGTLAKAMRKLGIEIEAPYPVIVMSEEKEI